MIGLVILISFALVNLGACQNVEDTEQRELENQYTNMFGDEVATLITEVELERDLALVTGNYDAISSMFTTAYYEHWFFRVNNTDPANYTIRFQQVTGVRVLSYEPDELVVVLACRRYENLSADSPTQLLRLIERAYYAFVWSDDQWLLGAYTIEGIPGDFDRDWQYVEPWQKELLGDLPQYLYRDCIPLNED